MDAKYANLKKASGLNEERSKLAERIAMSEMVLAELKLSENEKVYKIIGGVLFEKKPSTCMGEVRSRISIMKEDLTKLNDEIKKLNK